MRLLDATALSARSGLVDHRRTRVLVVEASDLARVRPWIRASSLVGVAGLQKVLLQVLNQVARLKRGLFDSLDAAKNWLAGQA
jgi:hypothetical protein